MAGTSAARAGQPRRVGVVVAVAVNLDSEEARAVAEALAEALRSRLGVDVIAGRETERRLPPEGLPDECIADAACRNDLGRRLDADELLMLVVVKMGDEIQIDATWANVASGDVSSRPQVRLSVGADRSDALAAAAPTLLPHIAKPERPKVDVVIVPQAGAGDAGSGRHFTPGTWVATGVAAAALVGGGVFALSAQRKFSALEEDHCREVACDGAEIDSLRSHALVADVLFGVSAASAVTALILYLRSDDTRARAETPPPAGLQVGAGPGDVGLSVRGAF